MYYFSDNNKIIVSRKKVLKKGAVSSVLIFLFLSLSTIAQNTDGETSLNPLYQKQSEKHDKSNFWLHRSQAYYKWDTIGADNWIYQYSIISLFDSTNAVMMSITVDTIQNNFLFKDTFEYANQKLISHKNYAWQHTAWIQNTQTTHAYDIYENDSATINYKWIAGQWQMVAGTKHQFQYNSDRFITEDATSNWNGSWNYYTKKTFGYSDFFLSEYAAYNWQDSSETWLPEKRMLYIPYPSSLKTQSATLQLPYSDSWINVQQYNYSYNGDDYTVVTDTVENYLWKHKEKLTYTISDYRIFKTLTEKYSGSIWYNFSKNTKTVNDYENLIENRSEFWNQGNWNLSDQDNYDYTYNADSIMTEKIYRKWNSNLQEMQNVEKFVYSNFLQTNYDISKVATPDESIIIYPNPVKNLIFFKTKELNVTNIDITYMNGKTMQIKNNPNIESIDVSRFQKGIYFIRFQLKNTTISKKIIKE